MTDSIDRRDYGVLEQKVTQLTTDVHELKIAVDSLREMMQQAQGGWKIMLAIGGAVATLATVGAWAVEHLNKH
jgi:hypothetical protein